jgi:site-specific DNA recombinase
MLAYGYCRYSSDMQNEKSIEQQKNELEDYAKKNNIKIKKYYIDEAKSGKYDTRDSFQELINDACKTKEIQAVLVWKTDRFARKAMDSLYYRNKLEKFGIKLISITQPIDTETPEGKLMSTLLAGMDEYFSQNLASNVKRALKSNAQNCQFNGGIAPLGYNIINKHYVINEQEAKIVQEIFNMYIDGMSYIDIALKLNMKGYKTKKNKPFAKTSVLSILENEKYTGKYIFNKGTKNSHRGMRKDAIVYEDAIPQIISKEIFKKAMERRKTKPHAENTAKRVYLLSGLIKCQCGGTYTGYLSTKVKNGNTFKYGYYKCNRRDKLNKCTMPFLKQELLENYIIELLTKKLLAKDNMQKLVNQVVMQYKNLQNEATEDVLSLKSRIKEIKVQMDNIVDLICRGMGTDALAYKLKDLEQKKYNLEDELNFKNSNFKIDIKSEDVIKILKRDVDELQDSSKNELKKLIRKWVKKIEVTNDFLDVYFYSEDFLPHQMVARNGFEPSTCRV